MNYFSKHLDSKFEEFLEKEITNFADQQNGLFREKSLARVIVEILLEHFDLYENVINYFLNDRSFTDYEIVEIAGTSMKSLIEDKGFDTLPAINRMLELKYSIKI